MQPFNGHRLARLSLPILEAIEHVAGHLRSGTADHLAEAVANLSLLFTKERSSLTRDYLDDPAHAAAYLRYFLPVNLAKVQALLDEVPGGWTEQLRDRPLRALDVGSGPGTGALALRDWLHHHDPDCLKQLAVVAVDSSAAALKQAHRLWTTYSREADADPNLFTCEGNVERAANGGWHDQVEQRAPYDLIILANCLNELFANAADPTEQRSAFVADLLQLLAPRGTLMIVEPALRQTSRALHQVRDRLLQQKRCTIYSPCLHEHDCPALANPDDWCHEERAWDAPAAIQQIDEAVGFIKDALKFSYLLLRKDGKTIVERRPNVYRVVSELRELKGEKRAWLCNELGRQEVGRQDRLASPQNATVDRWHRGAIVQIERIVRKEREGKVSALGRIERDAAVQMVRPA